LIAMDEAHRFLLGEHLPRLIERLLREGRKQRKHLQIVTQSSEDLPPNWEGLMSGICRPVGHHHEFLLEGGHGRTVIRARPGQQEWQALQPKN
jgi:Predicted ATPase